MKYLKSLIVDWANMPSLEFNLLMTFLVFVLVYRLGINRWMYLQYPKLRKFKPIYCDACFGFWLTLFISQHVLTAALAFLIYSFYEKNNNN
jgi:hypothetical protein